MASVRSVTVHFVIIQTAIYNTDLGVYQLEQQRSHSDHS